ncbi:uncharacterized protein ARB_03634 [Trichophyton benhamiae CBS 112371]|uniref:Uncharacterized protein n=1 Tax=Arthroderma benhamiae (strain ATCC MYA-4681 / CBS 112371) TaxID=663331 RepID=D4B594_ARTBC|nr:uncharacterized protein ARB_03634 [Trichophyton benhamiae CBS 112371]EFE29488.1 hypothetical protein ARB_03634 [Trichophyton benhamiae CBS 112371]
MTARCTFEEGHIAIPGFRETTFVPRKREYVCPGNIPNSRDNERCSAASAGILLQSPVHTAFAQACSQPPLSSTLAEIFSKVTSARTDADARVRTPHPCIQIYRVFRLISHSDTIY